MKKTLLTIILISIIFLNIACVDNKLDKKTRTQLKEIYEKTSQEIDFDNWLLQFNSYDISYSPNYTYVIGSIDTNINIFDYRTFDIINNYWVIDGINTNVKEFETPNLDNLFIEYGDNGNWIINGYDTNIKINYQNKIDTIEIDDYFIMKESGEIPKVETTDSDYNRQFYYYSSGVLTNQSYSEDGIVVEVERNYRLSSYMLQYNDLNKETPLTKGTKYNISFDIASNKTDSVIAVCLYKNNNSDMYYYEEFNLDNNDFNKISFDFIAEDEALFLKIYLGRTKATYILKNFSLSLDYMDYIKNEIDKAIPNIAYSSFTLPNSINPYLNIEYSTNYSTILNNEFIYIDPLGKQDVKITAHINYFNEDITLNYDFKVKSPLTKIPEIYITLTKDKHISNTDTYSKMSLDLIEYDTNGNITYSLQGETGGIRVRGNSTSTFSKKPYRIKFDSKVSLFGLPKAKSWVLLANHADQSLMRSYLAFNMGKVFDNMAFSPSAIYVDLYVNGIYYGNYLLTEQMQVNKGRVDIESNPNVINTGYLVEYDFHIDDGELEGIDYFRLNSENSYYFIKSPDRSDGLTNEQFNYIKDYITKVDKAIKNRSGYNDLIDIDTFIDYFWVQEIFKNIDCHQGSIYMYKEKDGKLKMGPIWDFDLSCGDDSQDMNAVKTDGWFSFLNYKNQWMYNLMKDPKFVTLFINRWHEKYEEILDIIELIPEVYDYILPSATNNFEIHDVIGKEKTWYTVDAVYNIKTYSGQVDYLYNWLKERVEWINNNVDSLRK